MGEASPEELDKLLERMGKIQDELDEPTNHLDVDAKAELQRALKTYKGKIVLVYHEPEFYEGWITKVWNVEEWSQNMSQAN